MKKVLLVSLNSKFVHANLGIRYLREYVKDKIDIEIKIREWTINNLIHEVLSGIYLEKPDLIGFSVYIWNVEMTFKIIKELKKLLPKVEILLGGPEVTFNSEGLMNRYSEIDYIISGEGEEPFFRLLNGEKEVSKSIYYRKNGKVQFNGQADYLEQMDKIPFPYQKEELSELKDKMLYYESSRGCAFKCSYCMSSVEKRVRFLSIDRVKSDLKFFIDNKIKMVKFVDRTYNLNKERYLEIWRFLIENYTEYTSFHFEIKLDMLDDEAFAVLEKAPKFYFQFEIGIQTMNTDALKAIDRTNSAAVLVENMKKINRNIATQLDIIAGLPYENYDSFKDSVEFVYRLKPSTMYLGFLKILKGAPINSILEENGYKYFDFPPYEVIENKFISYKDLILLRKIDKVIDIFLNTHKFEKSINYLFNKVYNRAVDFFEEFAIFLDLNGYFEVSHKIVANYEFLHSFAEKKIEKMEVFRECLKYDYLSLGKPGNFPKWFCRNIDKMKYEEALLKNGYTNLKDIYKRSEYEKFFYDVDTYYKNEYSILFIYNINDFLTKRI